MNFPEKLKNLRKEKGVSQEELAEKIFVSRSLIARYENGTSVPTKENLQKIALYFSVDLSYLLDDEDCVNIILTQKNTAMMIEKFFAVFIIIVLSLFCFLTVIPILELNGHVSLEAMQRLGDRTSCIRITLFEGNPFVLINFFTCLLNIGLSIAVLAVKPFKNKIWLVLANYIFAVINLFLIGGSIFCSISSFSEVNTGF